MIKIKLFDSKKPTESKELELTSEMMINGECLIGSSPDCGIALPSPEVSPVHSSIYFLEGQYYFTDPASLGGSQFNDEDVKANQKYLLNIDDIIRIGEFVLIIEAVALAGKTTTRNGQTTMGGAEGSPQAQTPPEARKKSIKQLQELKSLLKKNPQGDQKTTELVAPPLPTPQAAKISIPQGGKKTTELVAPTLPTSEYMPVALVPPDQISRWMKGDLTVHCVGVIDETHDVKTFRFAAATPMLFTYKPGQFVTLNLEINGKPVKRSYSISSTPSRPHTLEITVKRVPPPPDAPDVALGVVSNWLHDNIRVGSEIKLSGPLGKFTCFDNPDQKLLLISAGSGITPMMSMSRWMFDTAADCDIVFFHCARSPRDIIFRQELELMSSRQPKFRLAIATTRSEPGQAWWGFTGRLTEHMLHAIAPEFRQRTVYVCGPNAFMQGVKTMLEGLGFPMQNYYEESFGGPKKEKKQGLSPAPGKRAGGEEGEATPVPPSAPYPQRGPRVPQRGPRQFAQRGEPPHANGGRVPPALFSPPAPPAPEIAPPPASTSSWVVFAKSGKEVACDGQDSILDLAELEEVEIDSNCRSGVCGTCNRRKLEGEVKYEGNPDALDDSEQEEGYILTCIARPVGRVVIDA